MQDARFSEYRFGELEVQKKPFVHLGVKVLQEADFSEKPTQGEFAKNLTPLSTSPELWVSRQRPPASDEIKPRQCKLGGQCWLATVSRPDTHDRTVRSASRGDLPQGSDIYRIDDLAKTVQVR